MEVQSGWSTEFARQRGSVTVDETDLYRILAEAGVNAAVHGLVTEQEAFFILDAEARRLAAFMQVETEPNDPAHAKQVREWTDKLTERLGAVVAKYGG